MTSDNLTDILRILFDPVVEKALKNLAKTNTQYASQCLSLLEARAKLFQRKYELYSEKHDHETRR